MIKPCDLFSDPKHYTLGQSDTVKPGYRRSISNDRHRRVYYLCRKPTATKVFDWTGPSGVEQIHGLVDIVSLLNVRDKDSVHHNSLNARGL